VSKDDERDLIGRCSIMMGQEDRGSMDRHEEWLMKILTGTGTISGRAFKKLNARKKFR
jgi:hypothetical protein